jgi:O-antigen chain-terminating bifunctional methyltransferase/kinase
VLLIDYGSMVAEPRDQAWPHNLQLSLLILLQELLTGALRHPEPLRPVALSPWGLPSPWREWVLDFWHKPLDEWSYAALAAALEQQLALPAVPAPALLPEQARQLAMEQGLDTVSTQLAYISWLATRQEPRVEAAEYHLKQARAQVEYLADTTRIQLAAAQARAEAAISTAEQAAQSAAEAARFAAEAAGKNHAAVESLLASSSWRMTAPLRQLASSLYRLRQWLRRRVLAGFNAWRRLLLALAGLVLRRPRLRALSLGLLERVPALQRYLETRLLSGPLQEPPGGEFDTEAPELQRARRQLQRAARNASRDA